MRSLIALALIGSCLGCGDKPWAKALEQSATMVSEVTKTLEPGLLVVLDKKCKQDTAPCQARKECVAAARACSDGHCPALVTCCPELQRCFTRRERAGKAIAALHAAAADVLEAALIIRGLDVVPLPKEE